MDEREQILLENYDEYHEAAMSALNKQKYNAATTLFFKAIVALSDLFILKKEGIISSSHTNRFKLVKEKYPLLYDILDRDFPFYQDSYTNKMDEEAALLLKEDAEKIKKMAEER